MTMRSYVQRLLISEGKCEREDGKYRIPEVHLSSAGLGIKFCMNVACDSFMLTCTVSYTVFPTSLVLFLQLLCLLCCLCIFTWF